MGELSLDPVVAKGGLKAVELWPRRHLRDPSMSTPSVGPKEIQTSF